MSESADSAFFRLDGELVVGHDAARGPWSADACHAGPVTAVLARALEQALPGKQLARVTVTFQRPVPMAGFRVEATPERDGRNVAIAQAKLMASDGKICARASGLFIAAADHGALPTSSLPGPDFAEAAAGPFPVERAVHGLPFFSSGIEVAYPPGETPDPGPTTIWMRTLPIVDGERPSPFQALCPLADCGNGVSRNSTFAEATFVNPDLTIGIFRLPESEWLASAARSFWEPTGIGLSQAQLYDTEGAIGFALQMLIVQPVGN
ncbi:MAG: thioesterase family protein [Gammaproteobacteria bacterium]|nr:thioesterase family protein [Gammaproteobacteria bacterium]MDH3758103.1 thioesterase family protein [Gammaproteobacteria bacterium]MDH3846838.1 thioesterase family protein [Gammaproteobacteria bacterium]MDH3863006.1 thioesterase family protein [Gammaproteobacteria bacterium]MDH3906858.1 thioesterase family protein [Gammaproteobacteria bacterium]